MALANIYVPVNSARMDILVKPGSGIVALLDQSARAGYVVLYYEGNVYGAENLKTLEDRIKCAAGRMFNRYLTVAMIGLPKDELDQYVKAVGTIDDQYNIQFTDEAAARAYGQLHQPR